MKEKIAFVIAPFYTRISPHLGVGYLRACLEAEGFETDYFDFSAEYYREDKFLRGFYNKIMMSDGNTSYAPLESILQCFLGEKDADQTHRLADRFLISQAGELAERILAGNPMAVGFSIYDSSLLCSLYIAREIKKISRETSIIFGGPFLADRDIVGIINELHDTVDHVVIGEAEQSLLALISFLQDSKSCSYPAGCLALPADVEKDYRPSELLTDLNVLPFPEYRGAPFHAYQENLRFEMINLNLHTTGEHCLPITMGRGCPFSCSFCGHNAYWSRYRLRSVENVIEEMNHLWKVYGCRVFRFNDSLMNLKESWLEAFCEGLTRRDEKFYWYGHARADGMNETIAGKMYAAGCRYLKFGLESASDRILNLMNKGTNVRINRKALEVTRRSGMKCRANLIYCFPGETREEMEETISFILENQSYYSVLRYLEFQLIPRSAVALDPRAFNVSLQHFRSEFQNPEITRILQRIPRTWTSPDFPQEELDYRRHRTAETVGFLMEDEGGALFPPTFPELIQARFHEEALVQRDDALISNVETMIEEARADGSMTVVLSNILPLQASPYEGKILRAAAGPISIRDLLRIDGAGDSFSGDERKQILIGMIAKGFLKFTEKDG